MIADNFSSQLVELQNNIASREPGKRIPTTQEMEIMRKLTVCINNTKKTVSLPQVTQMMRMFRAYVFDNRKKEFASLVADVIDGFIEARSRFGYAPYELEFGVEKIQPIDPLYNPYSDTMAKPEEKKPTPKPATVRETSDGTKMYTIDTSNWSDEFRRTIISELGNIKKLGTILEEEEEIHSSIMEKMNAIMQNETSLIINDLDAKTQETTGNEPFSSHSSVAKATAKPETFLEGLRQAFLQNQPLNPNYEKPKTTSKTATIPENETPLIINDLDPKTPENTGNKPENPATQENATSTPSLPLSDSLSSSLPLSDSPSSLPPNDNLIRQGEVFSRPVYITPSWPFREEPRGNKYKY